LVGNPLREERRLGWGRILKRLFSDFGDKRGMLSPKNSEMFTNFSVKEILKGRNN
jgi:hypothetical protein